MENNQNRSIAMKTRMLFVLMSIAAVALFWHSTGCKKNPVAPEPRNLSWSVDTLAHPDNWQVSISDIWASSAKDVYAAGSANTTRGILWHYDGNRWRDIKISITEGGPITGAINFRDIYGFGPNDVWVVGDRLERNPNAPPNYFFHSLIVHYDGSGWHEIPSPPGNEINVVWGRSPDDVWFGGVNGTLFHYDGVSVKKDSLPLDIPPDISGGVYNTLSITGNESESYMLLADFNSKPNRYFLLELLNDKWVVRDSTFYFNSTNLWLSPWGTLYAPGNWTYYRNNGIWDVLLPGSSTLWSKGVFGTRPDNYFVTGRSNVAPYPGAVYHFNGSDWSSLPELQKLDNDYYDVWTDGSEVFIVAVSGNGSMVYHGK
ncbi:MAG: hypothetical protein H7A03_11775 [Pseudomonadales bacterium]|nr:hypothetical protein [Pseudomonadales bacterium]